MGNDEFVSWYADVSLLSDVARRAAAYLHDAPSRAVTPSESSIAALQGLAGPFPDSPSNPHEVLELLDRYGSPATVVNAAGRFFGFVNGGALPAAIAASWMVDAWDQNVALRIMSPTGAILEEIALGWAREALGLPTDCDGAVVTGATMANFVGLAAARHALLSRAGWDVQNDGLFGAPPLTVVVGDEVHVSLVKTLGLLGLGRRRVHAVAVDRQGRMRVDSLPPLDARTVVCLQAGNVNTGAFDPAKELCARAHDAGAWVHVDGAFGLWAASSPRYRHLVEGFSDADSWATDGHKWPNVGYDCGLAFVRAPQALQSAMASSSAYFVPGQQREPSQFTPEMSRRARGVELWATLRSLGRQGLASLIDRTCALARRFADGLRAQGFEIINDVVINQVLVSFGPPDLTRGVIERVQKDGTCWCGGTEWQGRTAMRISVSSWATTTNDVDMSLAAIGRAVDACRS
ncbi:MAG TPA: aminotransferase class V-fold PLP-dependent enzyme [Vicinamibacterales bacterium]|nr:aminotransferase class V-fold PLP-dependent enzyme [Vicinamibacterales bacterium]